MNKELICVSCPIGCRLQVEINNNEVTEVKNNRCPKGITYAKQECIAPKRILTAAVRLIHPKIKMLPVKTDIPIPKEKLLKCMEIIKKLPPQTDIKAGDIIISNILDTGANIIAVKNIQNLF